MTGVFDDPVLGGLFGDTSASALWSAPAQLGHFKAFETALTHALIAVGKVSAEDGKTALHAIATVDLNLDQLADGTRIDGLAIPDFVRQLRDAAGHARGAIHTGATSQDVMDTALSLTLCAVSDLLLDRLQALVLALDGLQATFGHRALMGRTRMQAALPITVGDRIDLWHRPLAGHMAALETLRPSIARLQLGGPVGTGASFGAPYRDIAQHMAKALQLGTGPVWHTDRTSIVDYANRLSLISGSLGKIGQDVVLMAQQGVDGIVLSGGGGSSAMPHKSNPVLAELLITLARFNASQVAGMQHALVHEQERSGAAWMLEWMLLPQMAVATARGLSAAQSLCDQVTQIGTGDAD